MAVCSFGLRSVSERAFEQCRACLHALVSRKTFLFESGKLLIVLKHAGTRKTTAAILTASNLASHHLFSMPVHCV